MREAIDSPAGLRSITRRTSTKTAAEIVAGTRAPLRPNDAIQVAVAIRLGTDAMVTHDDELAGAATAAGLAVFASGR